MRSSKRSSWPIGRDCRMRRRAGRPRARGYRTADATDPTSRRVLGGDGRPTTTPARPPDATCDALAATSTRPFEALVVAHQDRLYTIALRMLGDPRDAEEAAQDALVRAYRALATYDRPRIRELRLRGWLATIVLNRCRTTLGRRAARPAPRRSRSTPLVERRPRAGRDRAMPAGRPSPSERAERETLGRCGWPPCPPPTGPPIVLRHVDGLSYPEVAAALGRPEGTVKAQVHRGIALLRTMLEAEPDRRAPGDDRMTTDSTTAIEDRPGRPDRAGARRRLRPAVLVETGLADRFAAHRLADRPARRGLERAGRVDGRRDAGDASEFAARHQARTGPAGVSRRGAPAAAGRRHRRRLDGDRRVRIDLDLRGHTAVRAGRLAEGARDPARRGPAVRLDRGRDRPAEGGPRGRDGARPQPRPAHRAVPPGRADRRHDRPVLAGRARRTSGRSCAAEGLDPDAMEDAARAGERYVGSRHDAHRVPADVPHRPAHRGAQPRAVPVAGRRGRRRLSAVQGLPARSAAPVAA